MIREANKKLWKLWCEQMIANKETFKDVIFSDECTVQFDSNSKLCFCKIGQPSKLKSKSKHPFKVHVWAGTVYLLWRYKACNIYRNNDVHKL